MERWRREEGPGEEMAVGWCMLTFNFVSALEMVEDEPIAVELWGQHPGIELLWGHPVRPWGGHCHPSEPGGQSVQPKRIILEP